jgi:hypothetical protein
VRAEGKARVSDVVAGECVLDSQPVWIGQSEAWSKHTGGGCGRLFHPRVSLLSGFHSDVWSSALSSRHARDDSSEQRETDTLHVPAARQPRLGYPSSRREVFAPSPPVGPCHASIHETEGRRAVVCGPQRTQWVQHWVNGFSMTLPLQGDTVYLVFYT